MAERRPLVIIDGIVQELPLGDTIPGGTSFDEDLILCDSDFDAVFDADGNILLGV